MGKRTTGLLGALVWALVGCGQTSDEAGNSTSGGGSGSGGETAKGGAGNGGAGATAGSFAGQANATGGTSGGRGGTSGAGGSAPLCTPVAHERPMPGTLSRAFSEIASGLAGVYLVDAVFAQSKSCSAMCGAGNSLGGSAFGYRYIAIQAMSDRFDIVACETPQACADSHAVHLAVGSVDMAVSDQILSGQRTKVESPVGQVCTGATVSTWLTATSATSVRVDVESVNVTFPASYDAAVALYGCGGGDVETAAFGQDCNQLDVIDGTKVP